MSSAWSKDPQEPEQIADMHARRNQQNVSRSLAAKLRGFGPRSFDRQRTRQPRGSSTSKSRSDRTPPASLRQQRVIIKAYISQPLRSKAPQALRAHVRYLGRSEASVDGKPGIFYTADQVGVDAQQHVRSWADDRHHFRIIISPENGHRMLEMTGYVREVIRRVTHDMKTELDWVAVNHHNTDNAHAHVMIRGKRDNGQNLTIPRKYISRDFREQAQQVATLWLGERTVSEIEQAKDREIPAQRWTSLDKFIQQRLAPTQPPSTTQPFDLIALESFRTVDPEVPRRIKGRLQTLAQLGLATPGKKKTWYVDAGFRDKLTRLSERNDIIKQLYSALGLRASSVELWHRQLDPNQPPAVLQGVVIAKGRADEISGSRWMVLQDHVGTDQYVRVQQSEAYEDLKIGSVAEIGRDGLRNYHRCQTIITVAAANDGTYSAMLHSDYLAAQGEPLSDMERTAAVRSVAGYAAFLAGYDGSGVKSAAEQHTSNSSDPVREALSKTYVIDTQQLDTFSRRPPSSRDLHVVTLHPLKQQISAAAVTWLDHLIAQDTHSHVPSHPNSGVVPKALNERQQWLLDAGFGTMDASGRMSYHRDSWAKLAEQERGHMQSAIHRNYQKPVHFVSDGHSAEGIFRGLTAMHQGHAMVIESAHSVALVPVAEPPQNAKVGHQISAHIYRGGRVWVQDLTQPQRHQQQELFQRENDLEIEP